VVVVVVEVSLLLLRVSAVYPKLKIAAPSTLITQRIQSMPKVLPPPRSPHTRPRSLPRDARAA